MAEGMEYRVLSDGRRLDVLLSEETGLSRSRVASLMEDGLCVSGGKACTKADQAAGRAGNHPDSARSEGSCAEGGGYSSGNPV